jgi:hypothetical protein
MSTAISATAVEVWNSTHEPVGTTKLRRAMALVRNGKAMVFKSDDTRVIRTVGGIDLPFPTVILLLDYLHIPTEYAEKEFNRRAVLERDKYKCAYCGKPATTMDHIFPKSRGGKDEWMNAVAACLRCNGQKGNLTPKEAGMPLLFKPKIPMELFYRSNKPRRKKKR